jgi:galactitol PTS system EIIB component
MKKVMVCCGTSMITSSIVINKLKEVFKKEKMDVKFIQCNFSEAPSNARINQPDVIVPTGAMDSKAVGGIPVVRGTSFVTGVGVEQTINEILAILKKE